MDDALVEALQGGEAYLVGGAIRDEALGRPIVDVDVACRDPERAARRLRRRGGRAVFPLSEQHGAWRVAYEGGRTVDFTPIQGGSIEADLASRDFTLNAIARRLPNGEEIDPLGGRRDLEARRLRAVSDGIFRADPLRLLRAVRLEEELGLELEQPTLELVRGDAGLVARPAGERILAELLRLRAPGYRRLAELGLLDGLGGGTARLDILDSAARPELLLLAALGEAVFRLPLSGELRRLATTVFRADGPEGQSPRAIHRFRRATEPFALDVLAFRGLLDFNQLVEAARAAEPDEPLLRGDELGLAPGPEVGRLLERIAEERAAGTITSREEALELVRRET
jgi:hypothetical protein